MIRLVLDTNVLVSANLNDEGIEAAIVSLALNKKIGPLRFHTDPGRIRTSSAVSAVKIYSSGSGGFSGLPPRSQYCGLAHP